MIFKNFLHTFVWKFNKKKLSHLFVDLRIECCEICINYECCETLGFLFNLSDRFDF